MSEAKHFNSKKIQKCLQRAKQQRDKFENRINSLKVAHTSLNERLVLLYKKKQQQPQQPQQQQPLVLVQNSNYHEDDDDNNNMMQKKIENDNLNEIVNDLIDDLGNLKKSKNDIRTSYYMLGHDMTSNNENKCKFKN